MAQIYKFMAICLFVLGLSLAFGQPITPDNAPPAYPTPVFGGGSGGGGGGVQWEEQPNRLDCYKPCGDDDDGNGNITFYYCPGHYLVCDPGELPCLPIPDCY